LGVHEAVSEVDGDLDVSGSGWLGGLMLAHELVIFGGLCGSDCCGIGGLRTASGAGPPVLLVGREKGGSERQRTRFLNITTPGINKQET
jgi:hypothetical protein